MKKESLDALEMTRAIRDAMNEETKDLDGEDLIRYFKEKARRVTPRADEQRRNQNRSE